MLDKKTSFLVLFILILSVTLQTSHAANKAKNIKKNRKIASDERGFAQMQIPTNLPAPRMIDHDSPNDPLYGSLFRAAKHGEVKAKLIKTYSSACKANPASALCTSLKASVDEAARLEKTEESAFRSKSNSSPVIDISVKGGVIPACEFESFEPGPYDPIKVINLRFIVPVTSDEYARGGFTKDHDGIGNFAHNYTDHVNNIIESSNSLVSSNAVQTQINPPPPALPIGFRFRLHSLQQPVIPTSDLDNYYYFSNDTDNTGVWNYPWTNPYYSPLDGVINVAFQDQKGASPASRGSPLLINDSPALDAYGNWVMSWYPAFNVNSAGYVNTLAPTDQGAYIVIESEWLRYVLRQRYWNQSTTTNDPFMGPKDYTTGALFIHEAGHILGLAHTFSGNNNYVPGVGYIQCSDLPQWKSNPWCGDSSTTQNNVMDYNCSHSAWTPCQLMIAHYNLQTSLKKYRYLPLYSDHDYDTVIPANANVVWNSAHDLIGDLILGANAKLTVSCGSKLPLNGQIIKGPGAVIINENLITKRQKKDLGNLTPDNAVATNSLGNSSETAAQSGGIITPDSEKSGSPDSAATQKPFYQFWK